MLKKVAAISFWISFIVLGIKLGAYFITDSTAILSDALESVVNVVAAIAAFFVMRAVAEPADEEHPYGHGKLEYFSSAFEGGLITFAAIAIIIESYRAFISGTHLVAIDSGLVVMSFATVLNLFLGLWLLRKSKLGNSEALRASGLHIMSDVYTSCGILVGLGIYKITGWVWIDSILAGLVSIQLLFTGFKIVRSAIRGLIDEKDPNVLAALFDVINIKRKNWLIDVHELKIIRAGNFHHVDCHLIVPEFWDALKIHEGTHEFEKSISESYPFKTEFSFHIDPCKQSYCKNCNLENCHLRNNEFENTLELYKKQKKIRKTTLN